MTPRKSSARKPPLGPIAAKADRAARAILQRTRLRPRVAVVLGSGLGALADSFTEATRIPYTKIPGFRRSTAVGHAGQLVIGKSGGTAVVAMQGRLHLYEGYSAAEVAFPVRVFARMGVRAIVFTNAAGGIRPEFTSGTLVLIRDHINLQGANPLIGPNDDSLGPRFPDMTAAYDQPFLQIAHHAADRLRIPLPEGVYAGLAGPNYETPAEIRFLRAIGADLVGMSTVPEVLAARHAGLRVLGISCVTNAAAGILDQPLVHEEVLQTADRVSAQFISLLRALLPELDSAVS